MLVQLPCSKLSLAIYYMLYQFTNKFASVPIVNVLICVCVCVQKQQRMLKDRLTNEFSSVLSSFQAAQRQLADREKATINTRNASTVSCYLSGQEV